ncbi:MAG TPA: hypothetical protein VNU94_06630 [Acidobacteriaceae bacterium]|jgi:hypothetical protein|nr:hypothetical protein [Acidobacteriaceae bacterium]
MLSLKLVHVKIAVALGLVLSGLFLFEQDHKGLELLMVIAGIVYLYIRWHSYKRERYQARIKQ